METIKLFTFKLMLLFLTTSVLVNCESDAIVEAQEEVLTQAKQALYSSRLVYTNEIESNRIISERLRALPQTRNAASFENGTNGFTVETNTAMYIEKTDGSGYSYTFAVDRDGIETTTVENLVLSVNNDTQEVSSTLIAYQYSAAQLQELLTTGHVSTDAEIIATSINADFSGLLTENNSLPCTVHTTTYHIIPYDEDETRHYYGDNSQCNHINHETGVTECEVVTVTNIWCPPTSSGTQSSSSTTTTSNTGNQTSSDDPSTNTTNGGTTTTPNNNQPPNNTDDEIVSTPLTKTELNEISQQLNEIFGEGNWEFSDDPNLENAPNFETPEEVEEYLNSLMNSNFTFESSELNLQDNTRRDYHFMEFSSFPRASIRTSVKLSVPEPNTPLQKSDIISIRTILIGNTTFHKWTQLDTEAISPLESAPEVTINYNTNSLKIEVEGVMEIGFHMVGELVTVEKAVNVVITYDILTGQMKTQYSYWYYKED